MPLSRQPLALRLAMQFLSQWRTSSLGKTEASSSDSLLSLTSSWVTCLSRSGSSGTILEILFSLTEGGEGSEVQLRPGQVEVQWLRGQEQASGGGWLIAQCPEVWLAARLPCSTTGIKYWCSLKNIWFWFFQLSVCGLLKNIDTLLGRWRGV